MKSKIDRENGEREKENLQGDGECVRRHRMPPTVGADEVAGRRLVKYINKRLDVQWGPLCPPLSAVLFLRMWKI